MLESWITPDWFQIVNVHIFSSRVKLTMSVDLFSPQNHPMP